MDSIITCVSEKNKAWVSTLSPRDIAGILDSLALVPTFINTYPRSEIILDVDESSSEYSDKPALKGLAGEDEFEKMCKNMLSQQFTLINTSKKSKSGDFFIEWKSPETLRIYKFLVDIKNYKSTVPSKEVDKFYRDLELCSSLDGAILISLHSKIIGRNSVFHYEERFVNTSMIPVAYVCSNEPNVISEIIKFMCNLTEIRKTCNVKMASPEKIMMCIKDLESSIDLFSRSRGNLQDIKFILEKQFNKIFIDLLSVEHIFKSKICAITQALMYEQTSHHSGEIPKSNSSVKSNSDHIIDIHSDSEEKDIIVSLNNNCQNYKTDEENDNMFRHIWSAGNWSTCNIDGNEWTVIRDTDGISLTFKFSEKTVSFNISNFKPTFIADITSKKIGRITKKGYNAKLTTDSYEILCLVCGVPL